MNKEIWRGSDFLSFLKSKASWQPFIDANDVQDPRL